MNGLVGVVDWDAKTVINKPKDYDNSSQSILQPPLKRIQENSTSDITALNQFGKFVYQPINWDAKTARNKMINDWASSPLLPPTKRLIEKTNSEISQSYVNTFKTPFMQPRKFEKNTEIEDQSSIGPVPRLKSNRRMQEKSVSDFSAAPLNSPFLTLKRDLVKEQKSAKQPQQQYFQPIYNSKAFETEEGLGYKIDQYINKEANSNTSQSQSSQQNFKTNSNSQSNQVTIATIQGNAENGVTVVKVPEQVDNNTFGLNQQLKKLMRQSQERFQNSSNKIEIKYNGSFQLNRDSLIRSQNSQLKSQHSNHSENREEKKNKQQCGDTFANLEVSIQNQSAVNQAKSQQFKSNEIEEKAISEKSISDQTEETKDQQTISKTIL